MAFDFGNSNSNSGFNNNSSGYKNNDFGNKGFSDAPASPVESSLPTVYKESPYQPTNNLSDYRRDNGSGYNDYRNRKQPPKGFSFPSIGDIPTKLIAYIIGIASVIILIVVFRDEITAFISQILAWVITIAACWFILKLLFGRRRW